MILAARQTGEGSPVIILHGMFGQSRNWATVSRLLGGRRRCIALDLRNHGESGWDGRMDYPAMAEDIAETMAALGIDPCPVIGHSMGGKAAMTLALTRPETVAKLIVVDIAPVSYRSVGLGAYARAMESVDLAGMSRRAEVDSALSAAIPEDRIRGFLMQNLINDGGALRWRLNAPVLAGAAETLRAFPDPGGARYEGPALFVAGEHSDYVLPEHRETIRALFPRSRIASIKNAAHWVHADQPEAFAALAEGFLG